MTTAYHIPVLLEETIAALRVTAGKRYIDATLGGGGHGIEIVRRGGVLLGIDVDREAVEFSKKNFKSQIPNLKEGKDWKIVQGNFRDIEKIAKREGFEQVDGILFDLGVSSHQLDTPERGFSYRFDGAPIDLRLDQWVGSGARELLDKLREDDLYEIIATYGEEERARAISASVVRARQINPIRLMGDLKSVLKLAGVGEGELAAVLSRVTQALRIAVNDELTALKEAFIGSAHLLTAMGRIAVISFHSLEDRIVKKEFRKPDWNVITKKPIVPRDEEIARNRRARSAKLRVAEHIWRQNSDHL